MKPFLLIVAILLSGCDYNEAFKAVDSGLRTYYTPRPTPVPVYYQTVP